MAWTTNNTSAEFGAGINHLANTGRANAYTIGYAAQTTMGAQDDNSYERYQRDASGYTPGSMPEVADQLSNGSNDNLP